MASFRHTPQAVARLEQLKHASSQQSLLQAPAAATASLHHPSAYSELPGLASALQWPRCLPTLTCFAFLPYPCGARCCACLQNLLAATHVRAARLTQVRPTKTQLLSSQPPSMLRWACTLNRLPSSRSIMRTLASNLATMEAPSQRILHQSEC